MSKAVLSIKVFAIYLFIIAMILVIAPNALLPLFQLPTTSEVWIRVIGVLALNIGVFAWVAAQHADQHFMIASVYTRIFFFLATCAFAALSLASPMLIIFGLLDLAGGLWTHFAMRADGQSVAS